MQRQKSILSFLKKPSPDNESSAAAAASAASGGGSASYCDRLRRQRPPGLPAIPSAAPDRRTVKESEPFDEIREPTLRRRNRGGRFTWAAAAAVWRSREETIVKSRRLEFGKSRAQPENGQCLNPTYLSGFRANDGCGGDRPISTILHKFVREADSVTPSKRFSLVCICSEVKLVAFSRNAYQIALLSGQKGMVNFYPECDEAQNIQGLPKHRTPSQQPIKSYFTKLDGNFDNTDFLQFQTDPDMTGPETPATRPLVPRLKRIQEDHHKFGDKDNYFCLDSPKRIKPSQDSVIQNKVLAEVSETAANKFEWLNPSVIRDANKRRPCDPLYDKRTLYIPPDAFNKMSTSQKQYWSVKRQYMDIVLFFKVGKFYELYEIDAEIGHKELNWKITFSGVGKCRQVGISESGIDDAVEKLMDRGYKVGRMEQTETSNQAKARGSTAVIQRKLVHVFTPSTTVNGNVGPQAVHLLALKEVSPREVVYESRGLSKEAHKVLQKSSSAGSSAFQLTPLPLNTDFLDATEVKKLVQYKGYFKGSLNSWDSALSDVTHDDVALCALGGLIGHLSRMMLEDALQNGDIVPYHVFRSCLRMDAQTLVNLEIFSNNVNGGSSGKYQYSSCTLYKYLDHCITASGKRLLRKWICHPLKNVKEINDRLNVVEDLMKHSDITSIIALYLRKLPDLERLLGRVRASVGSSAALTLPVVGEKVLKQRVKAFGSVVKGLRIGIDLLLICRMEIILSRHYQKFCIFHCLVDHTLQDSDAETLNVLIESFIGKVAQWSLAIHALSCLDVLQSFAVAGSFSGHCMSRPVLLPAPPHSSFSHQQNGGPLLNVKGLWHPYALGANESGLVPNDVHLGEDSTGPHPLTLLLTGPNMGGKSTLLRATCLAVILAQLGCFVPCEMCVLSPVDVIFTRLGASDRIMSGESTFFVECAETAAILQNATVDSLVLLDELGRGTSTFDGYAIAYAVFRHLVEKVRCRLLFATHYHPLTKEFALHPNVSLQHMACAFKPKNANSLNGEMEPVFLYRLDPGACPESYGLQVAQMAGIPNNVVEAASKASQRLKVSLVKNFESSVARSEFSTLHEEWLKTLLAVSKNGICLDEEDVSDTLYCLWHEMKNPCRIRK
ncbi:DNA mismatch repair protein MSH7 [Acorus calamus]|uniref:DNA mismatch repair protein MSH7 n=1 Tax=Acorus calamus TaxID=4465 RepID=A0AAV9C0A7_ACOCL|nr:DNA mismatch repair protein MSH7 [Acorus calamus]